MNEEKLIELIESLKVRRKEIEHKGLTRYAEGRIASINEFMEELQTILESL